MRGKFTVDQKYQAVMEKAVYDTVEAALILYATPLSVSIGVAMTFLVPFIFSTSHTYHSNDVTYNTFTDHQTRGSSGGASVIANTNGTPSTIFDLHMGVDIQGTSSSNTQPVMDFFQYSNNLVLYNTTDFSWSSYYWLWYYDGPTYETSYGEPFFVVAEG
ncbi:MAG: hypothetical protein ACYDAZ_05775 [Thermoplasmataceae archaeon]